MGTMGIAEVILLLLVFLPLIFWIIALTDIVRSDFTGNNKTLWVLIVIFLPVIGSIIYLLIGRNQKV